MEEPVEDGRGQDLVPGEESPASPGYPCWAVRAGTAGRGE